MPANAANKQKVVNLMQQTNDLNSLGLLGQQAKDTPLLLDPKLLKYLNGLPSLALSETGRRNVCGRFGLTEEALTTALAECRRLKLRQPGRLPIPVKDFGAEALHCALALTGCPSPTAAQLDTALLEMYPAGGPTAASLVVAGWLVPTVDKTGLRLPPLAAVSPFSPHRNGNR